jgi:peptidoglycan hydrolase-like protein with peptidoglycan-binding domain
MVQIVSRASWGAGGSTAGRNVPLSSRRWFVGHWPGGAVAQDHRQVVRNIDAFHRNTQRWAIIGYNYLVARDGTIYEGAGLMVRGIHSPPRNTDGFGVCFLVGPGEQLPQAMRNSARALYDWLNRQTGRTLGRAGHRTHHPTECPGPNVYAWINQGMPATGGGTAPPPPTGPAGVPAFPGRILLQPPILRGEDVRVWQARVRARSDLPNITADGAYGPISQDAARRVQTIARLAVDGRVGPNTWPATWTTGAGAIGGGGAATGGISELASVAFWGGGASPEVHRAFVRRSDRAVMYSRNGGAPYQVVNGVARAGTGVSIATSQQGHVEIDWVNNGGAVVRALLPPGGGAQNWTWLDLGWQA